MVDGGTSRPLEMIPCDTVNEKVSFQTSKRLGDGGERSSAMNEFFPPRGGLNPNRGFIELSAFRAKRLRRLPHVEIFKWNSIADQIRVESTAKKPKRDRIRLALKYKALLDSGRFASRAVLARHLGVSRVQVTTSSTSKLLQEKETT
ncbi:hypothetical protein [Thalassoglobus sp.]|uniref:hypothetical protein n=1 Tax=Thalassoglobus sp. TaxID=2795869 RepID=UPI003AA7DB23